MGQTISKTTWTQAILNNFSEASAFMDVILFLYLDMSYLVSISNKLKFSIL
jgi:hypothetical protein